MQLNVHFTGCGLGIGVAVKVLLIPLGNVAYINHPLPRTIWKERGFF